MSQSTLFCLWKYFQQSLRSFLFPLKNCQMANIADHLCVEIGLLRIDQNRQNDIGGMSQKSNKRKEKRDMPQVSRNRLKLEKEPDRCGTMYIPTALRPVWKIPPGKGKVWHYTNFHLFHPFLQKGTSIFFFYEIPLLMSQGMLSQRLANNMQ